MTGLDRALGALLAGLVMAGIVAASHAPMAVHDSSSGVLRLAWSVLPERIETCRTQSEEELARLPPHMRQPVVCEGTTASYRLVVERPGAVPIDRVVRGGGLRQDRRLYVFEEIALPPGPAQVRVRFDRIEQGEAERTSERRFVPPHLALELAIDVRPGLVTLVTFDHDAGVLKVAGPPGQP